MTRDPSAGDAGAALLEAVVALAAVGLLVAGGADLHRAVVGARLASERTVAALTTATATAERARAAPLGPAAAAKAGEGGTTALWSRRGCDVGATAVREVPVRPDASPAAVGALRVVVPVVPDAVVVAVRTSAGDPAPDAVLDVTAADGTRATLRADAGGCVLLAASPGPVRVAATTVSGATGRTALAGDHRALGRHLGTAPPPVTVTVAGSGWVTVVVATDGVLPDRIEDGRLAWWRGGAGGPTAALGEVLLLPEGPQGVVVGTCGDPRAGGSAAAVTVPAGGEVVATVPLGHVVVARPATDDGRRLVLRRQRACPGTSARPTLSWDVGGGGGPLAAAVPDGTWEAVVEDADGSRRAGPATVVVSGADVVVPPW